MKKLLTIVVFALLVGCEKEDPCECYYSYEFNQYLPDKGWEGVLMRNPTSGERMQALHAECKAKGC